jgi:archaellum component FlaC
MRIDDNYLRGNRVDGEVVYSSDFNELEIVVKTAINANYTDIVNNNNYINDVANNFNDFVYTFTEAVNRHENDINNLNDVVNRHENDITLVKEQVRVADWRIQEVSKNINEFITGTYATDISRINKTVDGLVGTVNKHEDDISRIDETLSNLQENGTVSSVPVYYYNGLHNQENLDMFNEICGLFDNKSPFVLVGRFEVELQTGEDTFEMEEVIAPIQVKNFTDRETGGTVLSFATAPIWLGSQYNIATIGLVGEWGNFTDFQTIGWSSLQGPSVNVKTFEGYDETKTQVLKNINGVLTWVEE